jgi:hypothetical protein
MLNRLQPSINLQSNSSGLELDSFDQRSADALVPAGTTASYQKLKIPGPVRLSQLSWSAVLGPGAGETIALRLFRVRPASNPSGFGFIQLNSTFTVSTSTFTGAGNNVDISSSILPNLCVLDGEYLACSWVHAGTAVLQPLNMNWNFTPVGTAEAEPPATTTVYADVFG